MKKTNLRIPDDLKQRLDVVLGERNRRRRPGEPKISQNDYIVIALNRQVRIDERRTPPADVED